MLMYFKSKKKDRMECNNGTLSTEFTLCKRLTQLLLSQMTIKKLEKNNLTALVFLRDYLGHLLGHFYPKSGID